MIARGHAGKDRLGELSEEENNSGGKKSTRTMLHAISRPTLRDQGSASRRSLMRCGDRKGQRSAQYRAIKS